MPLGFYCCGNWSNATWGWKGYEGRQGKDWNNPQKKSAYWNIIQDHLSVSDTTQHGLHSPTSTISQVALQFATLKNLSWGFLLMGDLLNNLTKHEPAQGVKYVRLRFQSLMYTHTKIQALYLSLLRKQVPLYLGWGKRGGGKLMVNQRIVLVLRTISTYFKVHLMRFRLRSLLRWGDHPELSG